MKENEMKENEMKENEMKENEMKENEMKENEMKEPLQATTYYVACIVEPSNNFSCFDGLVYRLLPLS